MTRKKMKALLAIKKQIDSDVAAIVEGRMEIASGPEYSLTLEQCQKYFGKIGYRAEKIVRLYFQNVSDEDAARQLQITPDKVAGLYQRYLKLVLTLREAQA